MPCLDVWIRADASAVIGNGHVMRCLTLADSLRAAGARVRFCCARLPGDRCDWIEARGYAVHRLQAVDAAMPLDGDVLVVDHYQLGRDWEGANRGGRRLLVLDDLGREHDADWVLDQNLGEAVGQLGGQAADDALMAGPGFALLDSRFVLSADEGRPGDRRLLLSLGGTDPDNAVAAVLQALETMPMRLSGDVVLAGNAPHREAVAELIAASRHRWRLLLDVEDMAALMARAEVAIGAPGGSAWERCAMGLPTLLLATAENQLRNARALDALGAARFLGRHPDWAAQELRAAISALFEDDEPYLGMASAARAVCDGLGRLRVLARLLDVRAKDGRSVGLRWASREDAQRMFDWQCDPRTRRFSRQRSAPTWEGHCAWLAAKLAAEDCLFTVLLHGEEPAGVFRLDRLSGERDGGLWEVSVFVAPGRYRLGLGRAALSLGMAILPRADLLAHVAKENQASWGLFEAMGFVFDGENFVLNRGGLDESVGA